MSADGVIEKGKDAIVGELVKEASESPEMREAGRQLAVAAGTIAKSINVCLLPIAAVNFAYDKARNYFTGSFSDELGAKLEDIPGDAFTGPKASIVGPALQGLAFSCEEENLKEMYLGLIASSMDKRKSDSTHPAFVEVIKQMTSREAKNLAYFLGGISGKPIVELRSLNRNAKSWKEGIRHFWDYPEVDFCAVDDIFVLPAMVENWIRLGLLSVDYNVELTDKSAYEWVEKKKLFQAVKQAFERNGFEVKIIRGIITPTMFGHRFARVVGLLKKEF